MISTAATWFPARDCSGKRVALGGTRGVGGQVQVQRLQQQRDEHNAAGVLWKLEAHFLTSGSTYGLMAWVFLTLAKSQVNVIRWDDSIVLHVLSSFFARLLNPLNH